MKIWRRKPQDPQQRAEAKAARKILSDEIGRVWDAADAEMRVYHRGWTRLAIAYAVVIAVLCAVAVGLVIGGGSIPLIIAVLVPVMVFVSYVRYVYHGGRLSLSIWFFEPPSNY